MSISAALVTFVFSFVITGLVLNLVYYMNQALIYAYNFDLLTGSGQREGLMPTEMKQLLAAC